MVTFGIRGEKNLLNKIGNYGSEQHGITTRRMGMRYETF